MADQVNEPAILLLTGVLSWHLFAFYRTFFDVHYLGDCPIFQGAVQGVEEKEEPGCQLERPFET